MRLFVAVTPPAAALAELDAVVAPLRPEWPQLRWTSTDAWHVTLAFLGEVDDGVLPELRTRLERAAHRHPGRELSVRGAGAFSAAARARVLWAGIHGGQTAPVGRAAPAGRAALAELAASVAAGARRAGAPPPDEGRKYRPHLTLARSGEPADMRPLVRALAGFTGADWRATEVHLIRSRLGPRPRPSYEILGSWPLRAQADARGSSQ
jgi:RNA 2',3'-cyclic 3'-phosphodiesterase